MKYLKKFEEYDDYLGVDTDDIPTYRYRNQYDDLTPEEITKKLYDGIKLDYINERTIKNLLEAGADVFYIDDKIKETFIKMAISNGSIEQVDLLLKYGAIPIKSDFEFLEYIINDDDTPYDIDTIKEIKLMLQEHIKKIDK